MCFYGKQPSEYEHAVIQGFIDYPRTSLLVNEISYWNDNNIPIFHYDATVWSTFDQAVWLAFRHIEEGMIYRNDTKKAVDLILEHLKSVFKEKVVYKFDAFLLNQRVVPLLVISKYNITSINDLANSTQRSITIDCQKVIDILHIPEIEPVVMSARAQSMMYEFWIVTGMLILISPFLILGMVDLCCPSCFMPVRVESIKISKRKIK